MIQRDIYAEIMEGIESMREHREGKITLPAHVVEKQPVSCVDAQRIGTTRKKSTE